MLAKSEREDIGMKNQSRQLKKIAGTIFFVFILIGIIAPKLEAKTKEVRVGFFNFDGYHMMDKEENRSGYGYEYLQYMAKYTDFVYEYVGFDQNWEEMQNLLEEGKIDLLTSAHKTKDRMKKFDFSEKPIGNSNTILTVKAGDNQYITDDYTKLDGIRIGMIKENSRNKSLDNFSKVNKFKFHEVYYDTISELTKALQDGTEIDAIVSSSLRKIENEWIVASFDPDPFYVMVKKGNHAILNEVNKAMSQIEIDYPNLQTSLYSKYYSCDNGDEIPYSAKERDYISNLKKNGTKMKVMVNPDRAPLSYFVDGEAKGIIPTIAKEIFNRAGIDYIVEEADTRKDYNNNIKNTDISIRLDSRYDFNESEKYGFKLTDPYMESAISCVTLRNFTGEKKRVAGLEGSDIAEKYINKIYNKDEVTYYSSIDECVDAVLSGKEDAAYFYSYVAQRVVYKDVRNKLKEMAVPGTEMKFAISFRDTENPLLFSILNKAVNSLSKDQINQILQRETAIDLYSYSFSDFLYSNPIILITLIIVIAAALIFFIIFVFYIKNRKLEREKAKEFERFITYVCKVNDNVIEIDLENKMNYFYQLKDGVIVKEERKALTTDEMRERVCNNDWEMIDPIIVKDQIELIVEESKEIYFECRIKGEGDKCEWYSFSLQGIQKDEEHSKSIMVFMKNIDKTKREEENKKQVLRDALVSAQQASDAKGAFMSRMSHEIRTPLNAIIGYLSIARTCLDNKDKEQDCLAKSEFAAHHLLDIINDVLDISAIESGRMKLANVPFNLRHVLAGITSIFYAQAHEKDVNFRIDIKNLTEENLIGDSLRLNQILMNLLSNAIKFTPRGGNVTLIMNQKTIIDNRVHLQMIVKDTGIGISEDYKKRIFTPFEQQDASTARRFGGTGLGLSITKNLITMMNGTIDMDSKEGEGTDFTVGLSFEIHNITEKKNLYDFSDVKILLVYSRNSYESISSLIQRFGVENQVLFDVDEAAKYIKNKKAKSKLYDLCIVDWDLLGNEKAESIEKIKEAGIDAKPEIIVAAFDRNEVSAELKEKYNIDVILKPLFQSSVFDLLVDKCKMQTPLEEQLKNDKLKELEGTKLLIAEDNEMNMEIVREILTGMGFYVDGAENGEVAVEKFVQSVDGTYQAILMDIQMPVMDGYEAARRIRASHHTQAKSIPIIALTADAFAEDITRALSAGMNDHVSKPIDFHILIDVLKKYN